ncbi:MAG: DMT family transporter, partial [Candidatus Yanofskybacteria bacterium]|nr:DMT family transporter [Candidatus Yanofskybacteria bacterium]
LIFRPPLSFDLLAGNLWWLLLTSIGMTIVTNLIFYRALDDDRLGEIQTLDLLHNIPIIIFSSFIFTDERNFAVIIPAFIASIAVFWSHWEHHHFKIAKHTLPFLVWSVSTASVGASISKILLASWNPISLELVRSGAMALILGSLFFKYAGKISFKSFLLFLATNILTSIAWTVACLYRLSFLFERTHSMEESYGFCYCVIINRSCADYWIVAKEKLKIVSACGEERIPFELIQEYTAMAYIFVLLASLLWGSTAAVAKLLLADLTSLQVLFFNILFAFLGLLAVVLFQKKTVVIRDYTKKDYLTFARMGLLGIFLYTFFLLGALERLLAQEAFIINYLWPIMAVLFAILILKEKATPRKVLGIVCSFAGVALVVAKGDLSVLQFGNVIGVLFAVAGAVAYGLFSVLGKKQNHERYTSMMFYYLFALLYVFVTVILFSEIPQLSFYQFAGLFWLGVFTSGIAFVFWFLALKYGDTVKMSNIILLTPFISLVYIFFLVGEKILWSSIIGLAVIVMGIIIQSIKKPV